MKNLLYIPALLMLISCNRKLSAETISEEAVYEVLNFCLTSNEIAKDAKVLENQTMPDNPIMSPHRKMKYFAEEDIAFIQKQEADSIPLTIDPKKLSHPVKMASSKKLKQWYEDSRKLGSSAQFSDKVYHEYGGGYATFSKPRFSKNYKTAVIAYSTYCGRLCGEGATYILQKDKNGWKVAAVFNNWVS